MKISEERGSMLNGVLLMALFACAAFYIGEMNWAKTLSFSPLVIGIILGMAYANSLRNQLPETWVPGIAFTGKRLLRLGIILYGFRLSFQDVMAVGIPAIIIDGIIVTGTILLGILLGKLLKMDRSIAMLTACGSAICGAAAVMGVDGAIKPKPYKTAVAVATVVIFGTISMFLFPTLYHAGILDLSTSQMGIFTGSTIHEVAHAVGAGNAMGEEVGSVAIIVKMIRVMMLVPVLLILTYFVAKDVAGRKDRKAKGKITILGSPSFFWWSSVSIPSTCCPPARWSPSIPSTLSSSPWPWPPWVQRPVSRSSRRLASSLSCWHSFCGYG